MVFLISLIFIIYHFFFYLFIIILFYHSNVSAVLPGYFYNTSISPGCLPGSWDSLGFDGGYECPAGYYCLGESYSQPVECKIGDYCPKKTAVSDSLCPRNSYCPNPGLPAILCPDHSSSDRGKSSLKGCNCDRDYYKTVNATDEEECSPCVIGASCGGYNLNTGEEDPPKAQPGYVATTDAAVILKCFPNVACPGGTSYLDAIGDVTGDDSLCRRVYGGKPCNPLCANGYKGRACGECTADGDLKAFRSTGMCLLCRG